MVDLSPGCKVEAEGMAFSAWAWIVCQRTFLNSRAFSFNDGRNPKEIEQTQPPFNP